MQSSTLHTMEHEGGRDNVYNGLRKTRGKGKRENAEVVLSNERATHLSWREDAVIGMVVGVRP